MKQDIDISINRGLRDSESLWLEGGGLFSDGLTISERVQLFMRTWSFLVLEWFVFSFLTVYRCSSLSMTICFVFVYEDDYYTNPLIDNRMHCLYL